MCGEERWIMVNWWLVDALVKCYGWCRVMVVPWCREMVVPWCREMAAASEERRPGGLMANPALAHLLKNSLFR